MSVHTLDCPRQRRVECLPRGSGRRRNGLSFFPDLDGETPPRGAHHPASHPSHAVPILGTCHRFPQTTPFLPKTRRPGAIAYWVSPESHPKPEMHHGCPVSPGHLAPPPSCAGASTAPCRSRTATYLSVDGVRSTDWPIVLDSGDP